MMATTTKKIIPKATGHAPRKGQCFSYEVIGAICIYLHP